MNPAVREIHTPGLQKITYLIVLVYILQINSRLLEFVPLPYQAKILALLMYFGTIAIGGVQRTLKHPLGLLYLAITGWMIAGVPFSVWPGNSVDILVNNWFKVVPLFIAVYAVIYRVREVAKMVNLIAVGLTITAIIALYRGETLGDSGRLIISNGGSFGDPNTLAAAALLGLTHWASVWARTPMLLKRLSMLGPVALLMMVLLKTGSRGGLIGLAAVIGYVFWRASAQGKAALLVTCLAAGAIGIVVLPPEIRDRYLLLVGAEEKISTEQEGAEGSMEARSFLLKQSLILTIHNPVFGVGMGNFIHAEDGLAKSSGMLHGGAHETHNMYTQVSSELGIPALLMYIAIMVLTWRVLSKVERQWAPLHPNRLQVEQLAFWLKGSFVAFAVAGTFLSVGYADLLPVLAAIAAGFEKAAAGEVRAAAHVQPSRPTPPARRFIKRRPAFAPLPARS